MHAPETRGRPVAGLSLDLDNLWSYLRSYGDPSWRNYATFLDVAVPRIIELLADLNLKATIFVVGRDAEAAEHAGLMRALVDAGHELGNHSYDHDPNFSRFDKAALRADFDRSEAALGAITSAPVSAFRAPAFGLSLAVLRELARRGYRYDSSLFPTSIGPLARAWERLRFRRSADHANDYATTYGGFAAALGPLGAFRWRDLELLELPVSTMPGCRLPVHWTYLNFIAARSTALARAYLALHIVLARWGGLEPQLLLHSTDFIGRDDRAAPRFMPGMVHDAARKMAFLRDGLRRYCETWELLPLGEFVARRDTPGALDVRPTTQYFSDS